MRKIALGKSDLHVSTIGLGCMRMAQLSVEEALEVIEEALEVGINFFDHADIYGKGESERIFGKALKRSGVKREDIILQSKCGIRSGFFDYSKDYILESVDGILERLDTDYLDVLLLHRPDALVEPEEVAAAFDQLKAEGKVHYFGISNSNPLQIELIQKYFSDPLVVNQLQMSLAHTTLIDSGLHVNMKEEGGVNRDGEILDYCRLHDITIQPWSPFQIDLQKGIFLKNDSYKELNQCISRVATKHGISDEAVAIAWLLRHPANMQPIIGSMNTERIKRIAEAAHVMISRQEWYELYTSAGNTLP